MKFWRCDLNAVAMAQYVGKLVDISWPNGDGATAFIVGYKTEHRFAAGEEIVDCRLFSDEGYEFTKLEGATITGLPADQQHSIDLLREYFRDMTSRADPNVKVEMVRSLSLFSKG